MSLRFALEGLPPAMRAQAEAKLREGATIRGKADGEKVKPTRNKFKAERTTIDGITFDSKAEADRYCALVLEQKAGAIEGLELQKEYRLEIGGVHVCDYIADFTYWRWTNGKRGQVVEDVKGYKGGNSYRIFRLKAKLMKAVHGIEVVEV